MELLVREEVRRLRLRAVRLHAIGRTTRGGQRLWRQQSTDAGAVAMPECLEERGGGLARALLVGASGHGRRTGDQEGGKQGDEAERRRPH